MLLLLDTHAWIWSVEGEARRVGRRARAIISRAQSSESIRISPVTLFEVAALHTSGRLRLARPLEQWIRDALALPGARIAELSPTAAIDAGAIPRGALADPLDRLLVATARQLDAIFLTGDAEILDYARDTGNVRVHDAAL